VATIDQIKKLREETSVGVMDIKRALEDAGGDFVEAKKLLQERGVAKAAEKSEREVAEGLVASYIHTTGKIGAMVELFCETDFVARTADFQNLAHELAMQVAAANPEGVDELLEQEYIREPGKTVRDLVNEVMAKVGENVRVGRIARFQI